MAAVVTQDIKVTYIPLKRAELHYTIRGALDEQDAKEALNDVIALAYHGLALKEVQIETEVFDANHTDRSVFRATVLYANDKTELEKTVGFDTTGGQQHITQSLQTLGQYTFPSCTAPDFRGAVNYDGQEVKGVDIVVPAFTWTEQHHKTYGQCDQSYRATLANLTGTVNQSPFRGYAAGEVLFKGAVGQQVVINGDSKWQINYTFAVSPNRTNFYVGGILVSQKLGWDYLWTLYTPSVDNSLKVKVPYAVYVERLYAWSDFGDLEIE